MVNTLLADQLLESVSERLQEEPDETIIQGLTQLKELGHDWDDIAGALMEMVKEMTVREGEEIAEDRPGAQRNRGDDRSDFDPNRERPQKREFRDRHNRGQEEGMAKLFLSLGKRDRINPGDIVGMLHNECHLERGSVGHIKLMPNFSFVEVREEVAQQAINESRNAKLRGKSFKLDIDRGPGQGGGSNNFRSDDRKERRGGKGHRRRDDERRGGRRHDRQDRGSGKILDRSGRGKD
jgi:ATP-dependent RNA helicase DeaD